MNDDILKGKWAQLTKGDWVVTGLAGVDQQAGRLVFTGRMDGPLTEQVYALDYRKPDKPLRISDPAFFTGAKMAHLSLLPQGQPERHRRALRMVRQMNEERFGNCTNIGECEAVCPKSIKLEVIGRMNRDFIKASFTERGEPLRAEAG